MTTTVATEESVTKTTKAKKSATMTTDGKSNPKTATTEERRRRQLHGDDPGGTASVIDTRPSRSSERPLVTALMKLELRLGLA